jgi:hypothetical protein
MWVGSAGSAATYVSQLPELLATAIRLSELFVTAICLSELLAPTHPADKQSDEQPLKSTGCKSVHSTKVYKLYRSALTKIYKLYKPAPTQVYGLHRPAPTQAYRLYRPAPAQIYGLCRPPTCLDLPAG